MWDATGNSSWTYDEYGRTTTATRVVDGRSYVSANTYDALDRVREMTYPDNETLTYSYQPNTLLDGIQFSIGNLDLVSDIVYKDIGLLDSYTLGSSPTTATQSFEYWKIDDASRSPFAAIKRIKLSKDSTDLVNREMQYDAVGNVTKIVDGVNSETVDYTYDDLDRILTASVPTGESFAYDTIGNMTSKAGTALNYGTTTPKHAVKSHGTTTYTYDANGSMTAKGTQTVKYDPEQQSIRIQDGTSVHRATYDGDGVRRKRDDSNGTVHYLGSYERKLAGGSNSPETITKYYSASLGAMSRPMAFRRSGTLHWLSSDHLGGTIRVLDSSFTALDGMRYKPYGEDRDTGSSLNTDRKFTGQTEDEAAGLYWYASRAYDPAIGRFVMPDPIVPVPGNPQALNRYSYVYNNPLRYTDPSGHDPLGEDWENEWRKNHPGQELTDHHRRLRLLSLLIRGTEEDGSWSERDWAAFDKKPREFIAAVDPSNETGVERFARYTEELASWYSPSETENFVRAFGNLFADIPLSGRWDKALKKTGYGNRLKYLIIEPTGLKTEYLGDPRESQTHHYAAFVVSGYYLGAERAKVLNWLREAWGWFEDPGDIALGIVGANHGWALRVTDDPANLVSLIRTTLAK